jgi:hypothetical protein
VEQASRQQIRQTVQNLTEQQKFQLYNILGLEKAYDVFDEDLNVKNFYKKAVVIPSDMDLKIGRFAGYKKPSSRKSTNELLELEKLQQKRSDTIRIVESFIRDIQHDQDTEERKKAAAERRVRTTSIESETAAAEDSPAAAAESSPAAAAAAEEGRRRFVTLGGGGGALEHRFAGVNIVGGGGGGASRSLTFDDLGLLTLRSAQDLPPVTAPRGRVGGSGGGGGGAPSAAAAAAGGGGGDAPPIKLYASPAAAAAAARREVAAQAAADQAAERGPASARR